MTCVFVSPDRRRVEEDIDAIYLVTATGERGILRGHIALLAQLAEGSTVRLERASGTTRVLVGLRPFFQYRANEALVLTQGFVGEDETPSATT